MPHRAFCGLRPVLDFGQQLRLHPDALVCNPLCVGLCLADQRRQSFAQIGSGCLVEAVIDLTRIDQVVALAAGEIDDPRMPLRAAP